MPASILLTPHPTIPAKRALSTHLMLICRRVIQRCGLCSGGGACTSPLPPHTLCWRPRQSPVLACNRTGIQGGFVLKCCGHLWGWRRTRSWKSFFLFGLFVRVNKNKTLTFARIFLSNCSRTEWTSYEPNVIFQQNYLEFVSFSWEHTYFACLCTQKIEENAR